MNHMTEVLDARSVLSAAAAERDLAAQCSVEASRHMVEAVASARDEGLTWAEIADLIGNASRGQVYRRFQPLIDQLRGTSFVA